jgi:hypothetical protein
MLKRARRAKVRTEKAQMVPPVAAVVLVESTWVRETGMSALFERIPESKGPSGDVRIIFVTSYNISDSTFAEIVVYPKALEGRWVRVHVPKREIIAIMVLENPDKDAAVIGLKCSDE